MAAIMATRMAPGWIHEWPPDGYPDGSQMADRVAIRGDSWLVVAILPGLMSLVVQPSRIESRFAYIVRQLVAVSSGLS